MVPPRVPCLIALAAQLEAALAALWETLMVLLDVEGSGGTGRALVAPRG